MKVSGARVRAVLRKEMREFRRTRSIIVAMAFIPVIFLIQPLVTAFTLSSAAAHAIAHRHELLYMLAIPAVVPALLAAYAVVGERQQGTLEPLLTTPITRDELLLGKALAVLIPSVLVSYLVFGIFLVCVAIFASPGVPSALIAGPDVLAQVIFTPLIAMWSIWVACAMSARSSDLRVAQQLSTLASLPSIAVTTMLSAHVIHPSGRVAVIFGVVLLGLARLGWRISSALFDRERLLTGRRSSD